MHTDNSTGAAKFRVNAFHAAVRFQDPVKLRELLIANGVNIPAVQ